jgi:hypothetical protein
LVREDLLKDIFRLLKLARPFAGTYAAAMTALVVGSLAFLLIPNQLGRLIASLQSVEAGRSGKAAAEAAIMGAATVGAARHCFAGLYLPGISCVGTDCQPAAVQVLLEPGQ